jgi:hypothetical protein
MNHLFFDYHLSSNLKDSDVMEYEYWHLGIETRLWAACPRSHDLILSKTCTSSAKHSD